MKKSFYESTSISAKEYIDSLTEMPHFQVKSNFYDFEVEKHIKDTPEQFMDYLKDFVSNDRDMAKELLNQNMMELTIKKHFNDNFWNEIKTYLLSI